MKKALGFDSHRPLQLPCSPLMTERLVAAAKGGNKREQSPRVAPLARTADNSELLVGAGNLIPPVREHPRSQPADTIVKIS